MKTDIKHIFVSKNKYLSMLALTFFASGMWDTIAGVLYLTKIGTGKTINDPPTDRFYAIFLASFFFCFAYLQFLSAVNIKRYLFNVGCLILGRLFYVCQLIYFLFYVPEFPDDMTFTAAIDATFILLYLLFAAKANIRLKNLFCPAY